MESMINGYVESCTRVKSRIDELTRQKDYLKQQGDICTIEELDLDRRIRLLYCEYGQMQEVLELPVVPLRGVLLGVGAGLGQGVGLVFSKLGLQAYEAALPAEPALQAMALALVDLGFVSVSRAREILAGILHRKLVPSEGYVGKVQKKASRMLKGFLEEARAFCLEQRILHWDDTVIFMNTSRACFRFYGNEKVAYYTAHATKGASGIMEDGILSGLTEKTYLMHDHVKFNYRKEFLFRNIECIQHMERELERVFRASGHTWARDMKGLIQETVHQRKQYLKAGKDSFTSEETDLFEEKLENLLVRAHREQKAEGSRYFSTDEKNAIRKLEEYRSNYFAWVYDFTLPATNNISESGLRMTKTKQKVSGQFLKEETASEFAAVRTYTETCRKNGINEYDALERLMAGEPYTMQEILTGVS